MTKVNCTVDSCQFWADDQKCHAEEIWVKNDISGDPEQFSEHFINASSEEFSGDFGVKKEPKEKTPGIAQTSPQTCCDTMKPKSR